jgi:glycosyltransferase involved in cell wall biosynthesis
VRIGFASYYRKHENVALAFRLADFFQREGHDISFYSPLDRLYRVSPRWDRYAVCQDKVPYEGWLKQQQLVVWTEMFDPLYISVAIRHSVRTVALGLWDSITDHFRQGYQAADHVVCPSDASLEVLRRSLGLSNARMIPWDPGLPFTRSHSSRKKTRTNVLFPLHGDQTNRVNFKTTSLITEVLRACPWVSATLLYSSNSFNARTFKEIKETRKEFPAHHRFSVQVDTRFTREDVQMQYGLHDLVIWPSEIEGVGSIGLEALSMGTPFLAYQAAPMSEFVHDGKNSVLVPCDISYTPAGVPWVSARPSQFQEVLLHLLDDRERLTYLQSQTGLGLHERRREFVSGWKEILNSV